MSNFEITKKTRPLFEAFLKLKTADEVANFCRDLMTESEIQEFAGRFAVALELYQGKSQRKVAANTGISIATVTRVNQWLKRGMNGYQTVISRLTTNHSHSSKPLASGR